MAVVFGRKGAQKPPKATKVRSEASAAEELEDRLEALPLPKQTASGRPKIFLEMLGKTESCL